jgi:hypothetical protein
MVSERVLLILLSGVVAALVMAGLMAADGATLAQSIMVGLGSAGAVTVGVSTLLRKNGED